MHLLSAYNTSSNLIFDTIWLLHQQVSLQWDTPNMVHYITLHLTCGALHCIINVVQFTQKENVIRMKVDLLQVHESPLLLSSGQSYTHHNCIVTSTVFSLLQMINQNRSVFIKANTNVAYKVVSEMVLWISGSVHFIHVGNGTGGIR